VGLGYLLPSYCSINFQQVARLFKYKGKPRGKHSSTMIILDPSDNQNPPSPLKKDDEINIIPSAAPTMAPPPAYVPTQPPNPIIHNPIPSYQAIPHSHHHVTLHRRRSPLRRLFVAFAIAALILLLWGVFIDSLNKVARHFPGRRGYESKLTPQKEIDDPSRVLPIQYPPFHHP